MCRRVASVALKRNRVAGSGMELLSHWVACLYSSGLNNSYGVETNPPAGIRRHHLTPVRCRVGVKNDIEKRFPPGAPRPPQSRVNHLFEPERGRVEGCVAGGVGADFRKRTHFCKGT